MVGRDDLGAAPLAEGHGDGAVVKTVAQALFELHCVTVLRRDCTAVRCYSVARAIIDRLIGRSESVLSQRPEGTARCCDTCSDVPKPHSASRSVISSGDRNVSQGSPRSAAAGPTLAT